MFVWNVELEQKGKKINSSFHNEVFLVTLISLIMYKKTCSIILFNNNNVK